MTTTEALLDLDVAARFSTVRWDLLDSSLVRIGELHPQTLNAFITNDTTRTIMRTLGNLTVRWTEADGINVLTDRLAPYWVLENGDTIPLGIFLFGDASRSRHTRGADLAGTLVDQLHLLDFADGTVVSYAAGVNVSAALIAELTAGGIIDFTVDPSGVLIAQTVAWAPDVTRLKRMGDLCALAGFLPPFFDARGLCHCRGAPDPALATSFLSLDGLAYRGSIVERTDQLDAPNRYIVICSGSTATPIVGVYDIPASVPWSAQNRGFVAAKTVTVSGITDQAAADAMAQSLAAQDGKGFSHIELDSAPDPRHDTFDLVTWDGQIWLETGWTLNLTEGSANHHTLRSVPDA